MERERSAVHLQIAYLWGKSFARWEKEQSFVPWLRRHSERNECLGCLLLEAVTGVYRTVGAASKGHMLGHRQKVTMNHIIQNVSD
jgi:hypothetical protein